MSRISKTVPVIESSDWSDNYNESFIKCLDIPIAEQFMGQEIYSIGQTTIFSCLVKTESLLKTSRSTKMNIRNKREGKT